MHAFRSNSKNMFTTPASSAPRNNTQAPRPRIALVRVCINRSGSSVQTAFICMAQPALAFCPTSQLFTLAPAIHLSAQDGFLSTRTRSVECLQETSAQQVISLVNLSHLIVCQPASSISSALKPVGMILVHHSPVGCFDLSASTGRGHSEEFTSAKVGHGMGFPLATSTLCGEWIPFLQALEMRR